MPYYSYKSLAAAKRAIKRAKAEIKNASEYENAVLAKWMDEPSNDLRWSEVNYAANLLKAKRVHFTTMMVAINQTYPGVFNLKGELIEQLT